MQLLRDFAVRVGTEDDWFVSRVYAIDGNRFLVYNDEANGFINGFMWVNAGTVQLVDG